MKLPCPIRAATPLGIAFLLTAGLAAGRVPALAEDSFSAKIAPRTAVAETSFFVFYNDFWPNAHDAIVRAATDRYRDRPGRFADEAAAECFAGLSKEARAGWEAAVDYYGKTITPTWSFSDERLSFRYHFLGQVYPTGERTPEILGIGLAMLHAGAPAYHACLWEGQRDRNQEWIETLVPRLETHEKTLKKRIEDAHQVAWADARIPIDVVDYVSRYGADTAGSPSAHIQMSSTNAGYQGNHALEMAFHEASHLLMANDDAPIHRALERASEATGIELPRLLWHGILFKTAGWITQQVLAESGTEDYEPYDRSEDVFSNFHDSLDRAWEPYLRGEAGLEEAAKHLLELQR